MITRPGQDCTHASAASCESASNASVKTSGGPPTASVPNTGIRPIPPCHQTLYDSATCANGQASDIYRRSGNRRLRRLPAVLQWLFGIALITTCGVAAGCSEGGNGDAGLAYDKGKADGYEAGYAEAQRQFEVPSYNKGLDYGASWRDAWWLAYFGCLSERRTAAVCGEGADAAYGEHPPFREWTP